MEEQPKGEKIKQKWSEFSKSFTDVLGPLYGYLLSRVGKPWDETWSEICRYLPASNTNTSHVRDHVLDFVEVKVVMQGKTPYTTDGHHVSPYNRREFAFYVHPKTGLLCKIGAARRTKYVKKRLGVEIEGKPLFQYHKIEEVWYLVGLKTMPASWAYDYRKVEYDVAYKKVISSSDMNRIYGKLCVGISKKQLNSKEVKAAGL